MKVSVSTMGGVFVHAYGLPNPAESSFHDRFPAEHMQDLLTQLFAGKSE